MSREDLRERLLKDLYLKEISLKRVWDMVEQGRAMLTISAYRNTNSRAENNAASNALEAKIDGKYGYVKMIGYGQEKSSYESVREMLTDPNKEKWDFLVDEKIKYQINEQSGVWNILNIDGKVVSVLKSNLSSGDVLESLVGKESSKFLKISKEELFLVTSSNKDQLRNDGIAWMKQFKQDAIVYKPFNSRIASLIYSDGKVVTLGDIHFNTFATFSSKLRKNNLSTQEFAFESAVEKTTWMSGLMWHHRKDRLDEYVQIIDNYDKWTVSTQKLDDKDFDFYLRDLKGSLWGGYGSIDPNKRVYKI